MTAHLVWAFVALCALGFLAWREWRRDVRRDVIRRLEVLEVSAGDVTALKATLATVADDLKPIKAKHSANQFGAIGGGR